jgi:hypothetical protein
MYANRLFAALPDALTATIFLWTWIDPSQIGGGERVKQLMLVMLFEFIVMHSSAMIGSLVIGSANVYAKILSMLGLSVVYTLFVVVFAFAFSSYWPIWVFAWLFVCRFSFLITHRSVGADAAKRMQNSWGYSALTYVLGVFATTFLPLPRLGITPEVVQAMHLSTNMSGEWINRPWIVLAFGAFYFAVMAWNKFSMPAIPAQASKKPADSVAG